MPLHAARSRKVRGLLIADIGFRRIQAVPIGRSFKSLGIDGNQFVADAAISGLEIEGRIYSVHLPGGVNLGSGRNMASTGQSWSSAMRKARSTSSALKASPRRW